ncbi:Bicoid-interacting protein 3-domain-containing protein, partial [Scenedesmus sp. NREL 46B-D3]
MPDQQQWQDQRQQFRQLTSRVQQLSGQIKALTRVSFKAGNWLEQGCASNKYEVVTCFSVSKWVHLNWGDDGLIKLFHKFYRCLAPGGLLVLEAAALEVLPGSGAQARRHGSALFQARAAEAAARGLPGLPHTACGLCAGAAAECSVTGSWAWRSASQGLRPAQSWCWRKPACTGKL